MKKIFILVAILALPGLAHAADERARRDINGNPTLIAVDETTGEVRKVKVDSDGNLLTVSSGTAVLPPGAATEAKQDVGNTSVGSIDTKTPALGAAASAASVPVNIASDQVVPVSATALPLPTGAATSGNQTTGNASLSTIAGDTTSIDGKTPSQGQAAMAASVPVAIASDQSALPIDDTGNDVPTEACTSVTTAATVMSAVAGRKSNLICNEGPEVARCGSGSVTTLVGQRLLADQCYTLDGPGAPYKGAASCISVGGPATKICVVEGT